MWITIGGAFTQRIQEPRSFHLKSFTEETVKELHDTVNSCIKLKQTILPIHIESPGGYVYNLMGVLSAIEYARENGIKVATYVSGLAASCAALTFAFGDDGFRFASKNASIILHNISAGFAGKVDESKEYFINCEKLESRCFEKVSKHLKKNKDWLKKNLEKRKNYDWELTPEEALEVGIVNHIKTPSFVLAIQESCVVI